MKRIIDVLDEMGISYEIRDYDALIEFWTDTFGQDIPVEIDYDGTVEDLVEKFAKYADDYDVDEQVELFVGMRGKNGVPTTVRELVDDCQEAKDTLMEIAEKMNEAINKEKTETKVPEDGMAVATGHYINLYEGNRDVFIILNEANDPPTIVQVEKAKKIIERAFDEGNIWMVGYNSSVYEELEKVFGYGVQITFG